MKTIIKNNIGQKGYWKQRLVMQLSYKYRSLSLAWQIVNDLIYTIEIENRTKTFDWVQSITDSLSAHPETVITVGD
jgi:hypothetical protein